MRLLTATVLADGRIEIVTDPDSGIGWLLDDLTSHQPLTATQTGRMVTSGPLPGRLVQLIDASGQVLSNRVVVDDPTPSPPCSPSAQPARTPTAL